MLLDERNKYLTIEAAIGLDKDIIEKTRLAIGESIAGSVALKGEPLIIENVEDHEKFKRVSKDRYGSASLLCAPLKIKNKVIGVINMANKDGEENFSSNDLRLLTTFAAQAAIAVDDANQFERKRRRLIEFEILHEMTKEMQGINSLKEFREIMKLFRYLNSQIIYLVIFLPGKKQDLIQVQVQHNGEPLRIPLFLPGIKHLHTAERLLLTW